MAEIFQGFNQAEQSTVWYMVELILLLVLDLKRVEPYKTGLEGQVRWKVAS